MSVVFCSHARSRRVRALLWLSLAGAAATVWAGWGLFETFGLAPADGGVLKPFEQRLLLGGFVALLGVGLAASMLIYSGLYVVELRQDGGTVSIATLSLLGLRHFEVSRRDVRASEYHRGRMFTRMIVNTPWVTLWVRNRRWPFLIDLQAETVDVSGLSKLAPSATNLWQRDPWAPRHSP